MASVRRIGSRHRRRLILPLAILTFAAGLTVFFASAAGQGGPRIQRAGDPSNAPADLKSLLEGAAGYCDRLSRSVLDFICRERISEWCYPEASSRPARMMDFIRRGPRESNSYLYDYQLVRDRAGSIRETRTLLREGRKDVHVPEATLKTIFFWHAKIVMGPLGLLSRKRQAEHDYRIVGEERMDGERAAVVEAVSKPGITADHLYGIVWLRLKDASILKIEWNPSSIDNYAGVTETAERFRMTPRIVLTSEYGIEKNGIRFPSRYTVQETYARGSRRFQRSETTVVYDQYKFFTVETTVVF